MSRTPRGGRTVQALRISVAAVLVLAVVEAWWFPHANLAVYTTHVVMSSYPNTAFQRGWNGSSGGGRASWSAA